MAHLYIPLDGVPIVPSPPTPDFIAADGWVVFALSDRRFYAYNQALGIWQQAGGGIVVADTDSIDLTETSGTLTADVLISSDSAPVGSIKATITIQPAPNQGLLAVVAESDIKALFSATDTDSVDMTYSSGAYSTALKLSPTAASVGYQLVDLNVETGANAGLRAQISNASIQAALSVTDSNSIDLTYSGGAITGDVRLSSNVADAGYKIVPIDIQSTGVVGLRAQIAETDIQGSIAVQDTNSINLSYVTGTISGDIRLSGNLADAGNTRVDLDVQGSGSVGIRAQVQNTSIHALFSASAPISYAAGAFSFDTATTTLTAYLLKSGGTMTGAIVSAIPYSNLTVVTSMLQPSATAFANVSHLASTTLTFDATKGECFKFSINAEGHAGMEVCAYYKHGLLTILTDQENKYQEADSGSGFYITKGNNTGVITIKSRLGGTHKVLINIKEGVLLSATAWA